MAIALDHLFDDLQLLNPPVLRAAYSDRTAWLMAAMSELAYYKFEDKDMLASLARDLAELTNAENIEQRLHELVNGKTRNGNEDTLRKTLDLAGFELVNTYNRSETQGFLAKRKSDNGQGMLVLAFRGTEKNYKDIRTDLKSATTVVLGVEKAHSGFLQAINHVADPIRKDIAKHPSLPVYVTGHSLGGALAILATRLLVSDSQGACYTFGSPRVGNRFLDDQIKTPIYRVVNAADAVPRLPPQYLTDALIWLCDVFHITILSNQLRKVTGYVHYGDMRYLNHVEAESDETYPGLELYCNPEIISRAIWLVRRWIATFGKAAGQDHSISVYRTKLKAYAKQRSNVGAVKPDAKIQS